MSEPFYVISYVPLCVYVVQMRVVISLHVSIRYV